MYLLSGALPLALACTSVVTPDDAPPNSGSSNDVSGSTSSSDTGDDHAGSSSGGTSNGGAASAPSNAAGSASNSGDTSGATAKVSYANVTAVAATGTAGSYTFNVMVESADIDCSQYADWWEVLSENGSLVYRRILEHSHTDANGSSDPDAPGNTFTRSGGPVAVTETDVVVVRAHMSVGGYNGAVMRGSAAGGFVQATDLGADFASGVELEEPQPDGCEF